MPIESINLRENGMRVLKRAVFGRVPVTCRRIDLSDNDIEQIEPGAFAVPQQNLVIDCSGNRLPAQEIQRLAMQVEPSRFRTIFHAAARVLARGLNIVRWTSPIWATVLRWKLFTRYGHTMPYRIGNVLLNIPDAIYNARAGLYAELPHLAIDSCYNVGCLPRVQQYIQRKSGISMSEVGQAPLYAFGWWAGLGYVQGTNSALNQGAEAAGINRVARIFFGIYGLPREFDSSSPLTRISREILYPVGRWIHWQRGWWRALGYLHQRAVGLEQRLATRNHVVADRQRI